jgi:hypothetical protein
VSKLEDAALDVIDAVLAEGGSFERDAGDVLKDLADATDRPYKTVSLAVLYLEREGLAEVERWGAPESHRANKLVRVTLT